MAETRLRVAIAHENAETRNALHTAVVQQGHVVQLHAQNGQELVERTETDRPDLIIIQETLPDRPGLEAVRQACGGGAIPLIVVLDRWNGQLLGQRGSANVLAVLQEPIRSADLIPIIPLALQRFEQLQDLRSRADELLRELDALPAEPPED